MEFGIWLILAILEFEMFRATRGGATRGHRGSEVVGGGPHPTNGATRGHTGRGHTGPQGFGGRGAGPYFTNS